MGMTESLIQVGNDLETLFEDRAALEADLDRLCVCDPKILTEETQRLALKFPSLRAIGYLVSLNDQDRKNVLSTVLLDKAQAQFSEDLLTRLRRSSTLYRSLARVFPYSFLPASTEAWAKYLHDLAAWPVRPIWDDPESVPLRNLYVPAPYITPQPAQNRAISWIRNVPRSALSEDEIHYDPIPSLMQLLTQEPPLRRPIFVLGMSGTGKSSLAGMLAAALAVRVSTTPVLAPFRELDLSKPLFVAVQEMLEKRGHEAVSKELPYSPNIVLILDGLDELSAGDGSGFQLARSRCEEACRDRDLLGLRLLITSRYLPAEFEQGMTEVAPARIFQLLPFKRPQAEVWSRKWHDATGRNFDGARFWSMGESSSEFRAPSVSEAESDQDILRSFAARPLFLYLLARMEADGEQIEANPSSAAHVYRRILDWSCGRNGKQQGEWTPKSARRALQVAGFSTIVQQEHAKEAPDFPFLIRSVPGDRAEFTHRSLAEYLAAEHIARICERIGAVATSELEPPDFVLDVEQATQEWLKMAGVGFLSAEVVRFLKPMLGSRRTFESGLEQNQADRTRLANRMDAIYQELVKETARDWFTAAKIASSNHLLPSQVRGYALANLIMVASLVTTDGRFTPADNKPGDFFAAYHAIRAVMTTRREQFLISSHLAILPDKVKLFGKTQSVGLFLAGAWMEGFTAPQENLQHAVLTGSNLSHANLSEAMLAKADLSKTKLIGANLSGAILVDANLESADLRDANLCGALLLGAKLDGANLKGAKLNHACLDGADISRITLEDADFADASFRNITASDSSNIAIQAYARGYKHMAGEILAKSLECVNDRANNLAYLIRRNEVDHRIVEEFPLPELLSMAEATASNVFPLINRALAIAAGVQFAVNWDVADRIMAELILHKEERLEDVIGWWHPLAKQGDPEAHLVLGWLSRHHLIADPDSMTIGERMQFARDGGWSIPSWMNSSVD